jgi:hypothetical protein
MNTMRKVEGSRNRWMDRLHEQFEGYAKEHDSDTVSDLIAFNNAGEGKPGASFLNAKDQAMADTFHHIYQNILMPELEKIDPDKWGGAGIENYLGRLFKKGGSQATAETMIRTHGPFAGKAGFSKGRVYQWIDESIANGATPVTNNPIRMQLANINQVLKYITAHHAFNELKDGGLTKYYKLGEAPPTGWTRIDDSMFKPRYTQEGVRGLIESGNYYMHPDAAKVFNNWLKPGLRGDWRYDTARTVADTLNMAQLGLSAFHFTTTSLAGAATSDVALGLQQLSKGHPIRAIGSFAKGMTIIPSMIETYSLGHSLENEYLRPGSAPWAAKYARDLENVNGGIGQGLQWDQSRKIAFQQMWSQKGAMSKLNALGTKAIPAVAELSSRLLMRYYVPRIKLGIFAKMAAEAHESLRANGATADEINTEIGKIWDSVDNRAGQMRYKNRFWNPVIKDLSQIAVRSVGWSGGTLFELGGGAKDLAATLTGNSKSAAGGISPRTAYLVAAPILAAGVGGIMHYMMTGQVPRKTEDYFYPGPDGHKLSVPTYVGKDMASYYHHPIDTIGNKLGPLPEELGQLLRNADFYDVEIRHTGDNPLRQAGQVGKYLLKTNTPISFQALSQQKSRGDTVGERAGAFFGLTPAPAWIGRTKFEDEVYELGKRNWKAGPRTTEEFDRSRTISSLKSKVASGRVDPNELKQAVLDHKIKVSDLDKVLDTGSGETTTDSQFKSLNIRQQMGVLKYADPNELARYRTQLHFDQLEDMPDDERAQTIREINKLSK